MEGVFEALEKSKDKETVSTFKPTDQQLLDWLKGFQEIQSELNLCLTCLDDGVEEVETIARPSTSSTSITSSDKSDSDQSQTGGRIDEKAEIAKMDQVLEAFITCDFNVGNLCFEDDFVTKFTDSDQKSEKVPKEFESSPKVKEAKQLTRQEHFEDKIELENEKNCQLPTSLVSTNVLGIFS